MLRRPFSWLYPAWFLLCAILFVAVSGMEDPSRPPGRILSIEAGERAQALAKARGLEGYEVVHVAHARKGEGAAEDRWIVLLDRRERTRLRDAVVIELRTGDGELLRVRRPQT